MLRTIVRGTRAGTQALRDGDVMRRQDWVASHENSKLWEGLQCGPGLVHSVQPGVLPEIACEAHLVLLDLGCWHHLLTVNSAGRKGCDYQYSSCSIWVLISFPGGSDGKEYACNAGDLGSIPELGWSPGGGHGNPLQYCCLENPDGQRSLAAYGPWGCRELDTTERLSIAQRIWPRWNSSRPRAEDHLSFMFIFTLIIVKWGLSVGHILQLQLKR